MKFGHEFRQSLETGEYPPEWVESAIPYRKLKKCIKKVREELLNLGLDPTTLEKIWQESAFQARSLGVTRRQSISPLNYSLSEAAPQGFIPKLTIALDPSNGDPINAWLGPETKRYLRKLAESLSEVKGHRRLSTDSANPGQALTAGHQKDDMGPDMASVNTDTEQDSADTEVVEVPLVADSEFFQMLSREIASLEHLHHQQQTQLGTQIAQLGHELTTMRSSSSKMAKANIQSWREIFRLYIESQIFFSSHEQDTGKRDVPHAYRQLQKFQSLLTEQLGKGLKLDRTAGGALDRFVHINVELLRFMQFQDINRTALVKIMKKFDKRTALHAQTDVARRLGRGPFMAQDLAKATCFTISNELLALIPQLDDYLCPICFSISYKPVRLQCDHVFCIRCMVVMQRQGKDRCPLCRDAVVLEASSMNLDSKLQAFLKANFPEEVKAKQKANEIAAGIDRFGEGFEGSQKCILM